MIKRTVLHLRTALLSWLFLIYYCLCWLLCFAVVLSDCSWFAVACPWFSSVSCHFVFFCLSFLFETLLISLSNFFLLPYFSSSISFRFSYPYQVILPLSFLELSGFPCVLFSLFYFPCFIFHVLFSRCFIFLGVLFSVFYFSVFYFRGVLFSGVLFSRCFIFSVFVCSRVFISTWIFALICIFAGVLFSPVFISTWFLVTFRFLLFFFFGFTTFSATKGIEANELLIQAVKTLIFS